MRGMRKQSLLMQSQEQARRERADNRRELIRFARHECARFGEHLYGDAAECCKDFFCWTLGNSSMKFGNQALEDVFTKYDTDKSGLLDPFEFAKACSDLGLEAVSHTIFKALDEDNSGAISYKELMNAMVNKYIISAKGVDAAFEKFDSDKSGWLDATEFGRLCTSLGIDDLGTPLFAAVDHDRSGHVTNDELHRALVWKWEGRLDQFQPVDTTGFGQGPADVAFNGAVADHQPLCDGPVA